MKFNNYQLGGEFNISLFHYANCESFSKMHNVCINWCINWKVYIFKWRNNFLIYLLLSFHQVLCLFLVFSCVLTYYQLLIALKIRFDA